MQSMTENLVTWSRWQVMARTCAVSIVAIVAGCGGGGTSSPNVTVVTSTVPTPQPTPTPSPAATPAPTPTPTPMPTPTSTPTPVPVVAQAGDSIGAGVGAGDYDAISHLQSSVALTIVNASVSGRKLTEGYQKAPTEIYRYRTSNAPSILLIELGTNDLGAGQAGDALYDTALRPFVHAAKAAGFYVIVDTILPRSDPAWTPAQEQARLTYNARVRSNTAQADAVNDLAGDVEIGDVAGATRTYYPDGLHPNVLGQQRLSVLDLAVLQPFFSMPARSPN